MFFLTNFFFIYGYYKFFATLTIIGNFSKSKIRGRLLSMFFFLLVFNEKICMLKVAQHAMERAILGASFSEG